MSVIDDIRYIERGYEDFPAKLQSLGAQIEKVESERELQKFRLKIGWDTFHKLSCWQIQGAIVF